MNKIQDTHELIDKQSPAPAGLRHRKRGREKGKRGREKGDGGIKI